MRRVLIQCIMRGELTLLSNETLNVRIAYASEFFSFLGDDFKAALKVIPMNHER